VTAETKQQGPQTKPLESPSAEFLRATLQELTRMGLLNSPSAELYKTWTRGLYDLNERQIKHGVIKARDFTGFFNLPSFRELCRINPEDLGIPDCRAAYNECFAGGWRSDRAWSHPVVYHAARSTGSYEMQSMSEEKLYPLFKYNYDAMVRRAMDGEILDLPIQKVISSKMEVPKTEDEIEAQKVKAQEMMANLKKLFGN
jgi:hypothetical protein